MTLIEIIARLKLRYKIVSGKIYIIIEDGMWGPSPRPATKDEILEIKEREESDRKIKEILKKYGQKENEKD